MTVPARWDRDMPGLSFSQPKYKILQKLFVFAALVAYSTGSFAGRLAGCLTLTAAAFFHGILQIFSIQGFDMFHDRSSFV